MTRLPMLANLLPALPVLLAHVAGAVVAIVLVVRPEGRRTPALFALVGFALLAVLDVANLARGPLMRLLLHQTDTGIRLATAGVGCCYSVFDVAAILFLIIAIWQALSGAGTGE